MTDQEIIDALIELGSLAGARPQQGIQQKTPAILKVNDPERSSVPVQVEWRYNDGSFGVAFGLDIPNVLQAARTMIEAGFTSG